MSPEWAEEGVKSPFRKPKGPEISKCKVKIRKTRSVREVFALGRGVFQQPSGLISFAESVSVPVSALPSGR